MDPIYLFGNRYLQSPVRKMLFMHAFAGGKEVEDTATGNPLTFLTDLARPLKELLVSWTPTQSGSGDPSPDNVRPISGMSGVNVWHTGKNLLQNDEIKAEGNQFFLCASSSNYPFYLIPGTYTLSTTGKTAFAYYKKQGGSGVLIHGNAVNYGTFTITDGGNYQIWYYTAGATAEDFTDVQLEVGESATTYEAPQVGAFFPVTFPATGKNLLDINVFSRNGITASKVDGKVVLSGTAEGSAYSVEFVRQTLPAGTYTASISGLETGMECVITKDGQWYRSVTSATTFTLTGDALIGGYVRTSDGTEIDTTVAIMLEQGSSASTFEPYTSTIYGGTLDLVTGVLTATWAKVCMGDLTWGISNDRFFSTMSNVSPIVNKSSWGASDPIALCSIYKYANVSSNNGTDKAIGVYMGVLYARDTSYNMDATAFTEAMKTNDIPIVYELATPQTFQLSPQQITALIGDNTIWSDANGTCEVTYLKKG